MNKDQKLIAETYYKMYERALGSDDPIGLRDMDPELAKAAVTSGKQDGSNVDDNIKGGEQPVPVGTLKPMQKEVIPAKAFGMAVGFLLNGKPDLNNMEAIVSSDNHIMDGHHRWAAATLIDPNRTVKVHKVGMPSSDLVTALNAWTKAQNREGQPGKGDVTAFAATIPSIVDGALKNGVPGQFPITAEQVRQALAKIPGSNNDPMRGAAIVKQNATKLSTERPANAPERVDMPVVKPEEVDGVVKQLVDGNIDWNQPHAPAVQQKLNTSRPE
jgi:hypothetical protein